MINTAKVGHEMWTTRTHVKCQKKHLFFQFLLEKMIKLAKNQH